MSSSLSADLPCVACALAWWLVYRRVAREPRSVPQPASANNVQETKELPAENDRFKAATPLTGRRIELTHAVCARFAGASDVTSAVRGLGHLQGIIDRSSPMEHG